MIYLAIYLAVISLVAIIMTVSDKRRARQHRWRISEAALLLVSALGGSVAMLLTMLLIHHKTKHLKFMLGIPLIIVAQIALALVLWRVFHGCGTALHSAAGLRRHERQMVSEKPLRAFYQNDNTSQA